MSKFEGLTLAVEQSHRMTIMHPVTNQPLRIKGAPEGEDVAFIDVLSADGETARKHAREVGNKRLQRRGRARLKHEEFEEDEVDLLAKLTKGWKLATLDGAPMDLECTPRNARELYALPGAAWLAEQVNQAAADRSLFLKASSTSS
jgi:hypothetical protein